VDVSTFVSIFQSAARFDESTDHEQREGGEEPQILAKGPNTCTKEVYVSEAEPHISIQEHYIFATSTEVIVNAHTHKHHLIVEENHGTHQVKGQSDVRYVTHMIVRYIAHTNAACHTYE
jgi:hypothetical protein